ncbi:MAG TPA: carboxypeptidase-like regulatory domain-containing protein, partial [Rhodothermales bacterium]|nr:carboxypeptidase-like regulatory domain-containing protein [Rhodothermales bacterium]
MRLAKLLCLLALLLPTSAALAQTGKIAGRVTDASTGDPLPGVAVTIEGTTQGSATDLDGYYTILNVRPGTYNLQASFVGYTTQVQSDVGVRIDLTTTIDFQMREQTVGLGEVVVQAERPVVQP